MNFVVAYSDKENKIAHLLTEEEAEELKRDNPFDPRFDKYQVEYLPLNEETIERIKKEKIRFYDTYYVMSKGSDFYKPEPEKQKVIDELKKLI